MTLLGELEAVIEVKACADKIHEVFSCRPHIVTSISPQSVQSCELIEGQWGQPGSVIRWTFTRHAGSPQIVKEVIEVIDNENYKTVYKLIEGSVLEKLYKSFYSIAKVSHHHPHDDDLKDDMGGGGGGGSLVHFSYKYEKQDEGVPDLDTNVLEMMINIVKNIDAYLLHHQDPPYPLHDTHQPPHGP